MIGERLKKLRKKQNVKIEDIANELSVSIQAYYKYENNVNEPNLENVKKLAKLFHVTADELLGSKTNLINLEALETQKANIIKKVLSMNNNQINRVDDFVNGMMGD